MKTAHGKYWTNKECDLTLEICYYLHLSKIIKGKREHYIKLAEEKFNEIKFPKYPPDKVFSD